MIIACIAKDELVNMGEFPSVEEAREVYGEQSDIIQFQNEEEFEEFRQVIHSMNQFHECMELMVSEKYNF